VNKRRRKIDGSETRRPIQAWFLDVEDIALEVDEVRYAAFDIQGFLELLPPQDSVAVMKAYCEGIVKGFQLSRPRPKRRIIGRLSDQGTEDKPPP
jgi:hypothetical protein